MYWQLTTIYTVDTSIAYQQFRFFLNNLVALKRAGFGSP